MVVEANREDTPVSTAPGVVATTGATPAAAAPARTTPVDAANTRTPPVSRAAARTALAGGAAAQNQGSEIVPRDSTGNEPNANQSTTTRVWAVQPNHFGQSMATTTTTTTTTPLRRPSGVTRANQMFCCYSFFLFLGFGCVVMGVGIMIQRLHSDRLGDVLGYCILIIFGICLQLYAIFDIFKYVEAERIYNERRMRRSRGPELFIYPQDSPLPPLVTVGEGDEGNNNNVVDLVPTELPPAYQSTTSHRIASDMMILHPVTSLPLSTPPSYRTINSNNNAGQHPLAITPLGD